ncbi:MAG: type II toxin-antitoxin system RelE/ParE family toxin [Cyanobacteria bacterium J06576_12]
MSQTLKDIEWVGDALDNLKAFPEEVQRSMGFALYRAQQGKMHPDAKPLKGFKGAGVLEVVESFSGNAYRAVYTVKFKDVVYVLHAFQKKSKNKISTPKKDIELINTRLKRATEHYKSIPKTKN